MRNSSDSVTRVVADSYVVDTGVFLRWFVDQDGFEHARELQQKLVAGSTAVETVDFARVEVAGVLRKKGLLPDGSRLRSSPRRSALSMTSG
jgi:predicted nucleic acid-binding protein